VAAHVVLGGSTPKNRSLAILSKNHPPYLDLAQTPTSINYGSAHITQDGRPQTIIAQFLYQDEQLNIKAMTAGLSKAILPICKPTSRVKIRDSKQSRIHYFMHDINSK
jgi:hypothetical protein